jgi:AraC-like DNA-binding protein
MLCRDRGSKGTTLLTDGATLAARERPLVRFSTEDFYAQDRAEAYRSLYAGGTDVTCLGSGFAARLEARPLGEVVVFERWLSEVAHDRTVQRIRQDGLEHFVMQTPLSGTLRTRTADGTGLIHPGQIVLFDARRPYRTQCDSVHLLTFSIARYVVERAFAGAGDLHGRIFPASEGAILADFMASMTRHAWRLSADALADTTGIFSELLALTLRQSDVSSDFGDVMRNKLDIARRIVEDQLPRRDFDPDFLASRVGMSRSRLYELFKPLGGVARYIQSRRTHRFRALLSQPRDLRSMAELAYACGFASESHASRSFREIFSVPPGQFRNRQGREPANSNPIVRDLPGGFDGWVSSLGMKSPAMRL